MRRLRAEIAVLQRQIEHTQRTNTENVDNMPRDREMFLGIFHRLFKDCDEAERIEAIDGANGAFGGFRGYILTSIPVIIPIQSVEEG